MKLYHMTANTLRKMILSKEISCVDLVNEIIERIRELEPDINGYITVLEEDALVRANRIDKRIASGETLGAFAGIPIALKDNICLSNVPTTCGSKHLEKFIPPYNATVVDRLMAADAIIIGKTNMDEFAIGASTQTSFFGPTKNPWDLSRVPGGSSGGSAAVVAAGEAICALGTDTGGSIRQPASFCGVVGMKPTYGYISRFGVVAMASSLDHVGPLSKDVVDSALLLSVLGGVDPKDATSQEVDTSNLLSFVTRDSDLKGMKIGVIKELFDGNVESGIKESIMAAVKILEEHGAEIVEVSIPHLKYAATVYYVLVCAEASSNLAKFDGLGYGYNHEEYDDLVSMYLENRGKSLGPEVKQRISFGTYVLSTGNYDKYYLEAQKTRTLIREDIAKAFESCTCLVSPTSTMFPFKLGQEFDSVSSMYFSDMCAILANLPGIPAVSVPCGLVGKLPVGMQVMGKHFDEGVVLKVARVVEENTKDIIDKGRLEVLV
jgi:aspartyl-tRNA(Asn)/glutamyl-tRNA(Gln) amidotransferase subunit A